MTRFVETDLSTRVYRVSFGINEAITTVANEPSVGLYRLQEHVLGVVPKLLEDRHSLEVVCERVKGANFDLDNDKEVVQAMRGINQFKEVQNTLEKTIKLKQQLNRIELEKQMIASGDSQGASPMSLKKAYGSVTPGLLPHGEYSINTGATINQIESLSYQKLENW